MRPCECGCGRDLMKRRAGVIYASPACKQRVYRRKVKRAAEAAGLPANLSLKVAEAGSPISTGNGDRRVTADERSRLSRRASKDRLADAVAMHDAMTELRTIRLGDVEQIAKVARRIARLADRQRAYQLFVTKYGEEPHPAPKPTSRAA